MLYTEADLEASMDRIECINFHEEREVNGIRFWAYTAGHVLGAAMFMIEIAGVKVRNCFSKITVQFLWVILRIATSIMSVFEGFVYRRFFQRRGPAFVCR